MKCVSIAGALDEAEIQATGGAWKAVRAAASRKRTRQEGDADSGRPAILRHVAATRIPRWCGLTAGPLQLQRGHTGITDLDRVVLTPLAGGHELVASGFAAFEKRSPRLGVHLGLRRDCGSTFAPGRSAANRAGEKLTRFVFEGAIRNFPSSRCGKGQRQLSRGHS